MANYLWMNPVAQTMYGDELAAVTKELERMGYQLVGCEPQLSNVKNKYADYEKTANRTILDCRCPETIRLLEQHNLTDSFDIPDIEPILVHTARKLYDIYVKEENDTLIITCPCTQLRDFTANRLKEKKEIQCYTWKEFMESKGKKSIKTDDMTPIPLGFFDDVFEKVLKLSKEEVILDGITNLCATENKSYEIVEMLYCKDGCHNGNGL